MCNRDLISNVTGWSEMVTNTSLYFRRMLLHHIVHVKLYSNRTYAMCNYEYYVTRFSSISRNSYQFEAATYFSKCGSSLLESSYVRTSNSQHKQSSFIANVFNVQLVKCQMNGK